MSVDSHRDALSIQTAVNLRLRHPRNLEGMVEFLLFILKLLHVGEHYFGPVLLLRDLLMVLITGSLKAARVVNFHLFISTI